MSLRKLLRFTAILLITATVTCNLQSQYLATDLLVDKGKCSIPFEYENGFIVVEGVFNSAIPLKFIVDTGAEHCILFDKKLTDALFLPYEREVKIIGSDLSLEMKAHIIRKTSIRLKKAPTVTRDIIVLDQNYLRIKQISGIDIDGIIGGEFFRGLVLEIDYKKKKLNIYHPDQYKADQKATVHDIFVASHKPYVNVQCLSGDTQAKDTTSIDLLLDTGAAITFMLLTDSDSTVTMPKKIIPGNLGRGLGGDLTGMIGRTRHLGIKGYSFDEALTYFQFADSIVIELDDLNRRGLIGNYVLSRFDKVAIDYTYEKLYLKPGKNLNKKFEYDKSGLNIYAIGRYLDKYYVQSVLVDSPADRAGILPGDIITKVGWWSTKWYSLESITNKLKGKSGKKIKFTINRKGEKLKKSFILRDLFEDNKRQS